VGLLGEAVAAHGGAERFDTIEEVHVSLRCGGVALPSRGQPGALSRLEARVRTREPHVRFLDWPRPGETGTFHGWRAWIEGQGARARIRSGRHRRLRWDSLDVLHFAGYALWNYVTAPFLFARPGFETRELPGRRLEVLFPREVPTHSRRQVLHLDAEGRIARLDYTAEVFGRWARGAHLCLRYETHSGLVVPVRRRVVPRGPGERPLPGPTVVSIAFDRFVAVAGSSA
jgi:hypothetical protein